MKQISFDRMLSTTSKNLVEVIVEDYDLGGNDFMGQVSVPLVTLKDRKEVRKWFKLQNKEGTMDGKDRGEILLAFRWTYDIRAKPPVAKGGLDALEDIKPKRRVSSPPKRERKKTVVKKEVVKAPEPRLVDTYGNWMEYEDVETKKMYWYNSATFVSTWQMPGFVKEEKKKR
jgi:hypothetical protein